jgi:hypothetical protein
MCLDDFTKAIAVANNIELVSERRFRVSSWAAVGAPLLKGLLPISLLKAFAHYVDTHALGDSLGVGGTTLAPPAMKFGGASSTALAYLRHPSHPKPRDWWKTQLKAAHPWGFWGACPGGVKPPPMVVAAPLQFAIPASASSARGKAVTCGADADADADGSGLVCDRLHKVVKKSQRRAEALRARQEAEEARRHKNVWDTAAYLRDVRVADDDGSGDDGEDSIADLHESFSIPWYPRLTGTVSKSGC